MIRQTYSHGFNKTLNAVINYSTDCMYLIERPFDLLSNAILRTIKLVGSPTYKTPKIKIAIFEETNKYKEFRIIWIGEIVNDGKYGDSIYYAENLNVQCPNNVYVGVLYERGTNLNKNTLFVDSSQNTWHNRYTTKFNFSDFKEGFLFDTKVDGARSDYHFPLQFEFDMKEEPKVLFQDESTEYKVFKPERYENIANVTMNSTHISSSGTHENHPNTLWNLFDENDNTFWISSTETTFPKYVKYDFGVPTTLDRFEMTPAKSPVHGQNDWGIRSWTLYGSNDDVSYREVFKSDITTSNKNLDQYNYANGNGLRFVNFINSKPTFRYFKVEFKDTYVSAIPYSNIIAIQHMRFMKLREKTWESIGVDVTESDFINYGMTIDEVENMTNEDFNELQGNYTIQVFVEDANLDKISIVKETEEQIWLRNETTDEFDVVRYTENIYLEEAKYIIDNGNKTLKDYFNTVDVSVYTEEPNPTKKQIEINQQYSPLDELSGDIEMYEYSDIDLARSPKADKSIFEEDYTHSINGAYVDSVEINLNDTKGKANRIINP
ncbi:discoidin domain-containing protein [Brevibacillus laterosporus]|uniref:discoidin domain-containing protein n=1 Tax=Brevibacillus laterosporus TaxID=1465 RepID=UPI0006BDCE4D|nr:putative carbohydrate binding family 25 [Brevibacillus phage Sundance]ALA47867.1 putative carbohydrate binding family 25 [Brevibacillus phage Sundance]